MTKVILYTKDGEAFKVTPAFKRNKVKAGYGKVFMMNPYGRYVPIFDAIPLTMAEEMFSNFEKREIEEADIYER